jgi:purine-binding chemotaxis protein CheW
MAASRGVSGLHELLVCRVGRKTCGISLAHVIETMRPLPIEPFAHLPEQALGLTMIRGRPTPVIDARRLLGSSEAGVAQRFITLRAGSDRHVALVVDEVIGVRAIDEATLEQLPALARDQKLDAVSALGALDRQLFLVLEHTHLLPESVWLRLAQETQS